MAKVVNEARYKYITSLLYKYNFIYTSTIPSVKFDDDDDDVGGLGP